MPDFSCVITGCALIVPYESKWLHGDLHRGPEGGWVFNGGYSERGQQTAWQYTGMREPEEGKALVVVGPYWERRGVVVLPDSSGVLNSRARQYVGALRVSLSSPFSSENSNA